MPQMNKRPDVPAPSLLRRLARDNQQMGKRLAQLEFRVMQLELANPELFHLNIDIPGDPQSPPASPPPITDRLTEARLPALNVPMGKIAWVTEPDSLPVVGIFCPDCEHAILQSAMRDLMATYNELPFARMVFLCASLRPIPFLGRYNFAYEYLGTQNLAAAARRAHARFGVEEVRDILGGKVLWKA